MCCEMNAVYLTIAKLSCQANEKEALIKYANYHLYNVEVSGCLLTTN